MSKKKLKTDGIYFSGKASDDVTGSQYYIKFANTKILLECGLHQSSSNSYLDSYKINSEKFKFKPNEIDYVFVAHPHIDHCGLLPRLVREGFNGRIICTRNTYYIMKELLLNSCFIVNDEARILSKKYKREYQPLYSISDVYKTMDMVYIYDEYNSVYKINDEVSFQWLRNSHCLGAAQLQLILNDGIKTKKVLYTSDIGALDTCNHYVQNTVIPDMYNDVVIMESTYGDKKRGTNKTRSFDVKHLKTAVDSVIERRGSVIMPCFSFSRTQELLTTIYEIYSQDKDFKTPVYVDSKLSCDMCELYSELLNDEDLDKWRSVCEWENLHYIYEKELSQVIVADSSPKIVISSSGFCTNGRIVNYLKKYLKDTDSMIVFSGYTGDNPSYLSYRIKNYRDNRFISINKEQIPNRADCMVLSTFSSHANYNDLIKYGSSLNTNKLVLVHGSIDSKKCLKNGLEKAISLNDRSYRVVCSFKDMIIHL